MILCFPDLDTFRLVVTGTLLPADVMLAPAQAHRTADGRVFIDTPGKLTKKATGELSKLGVSAAKALPGEGEPISCWLQVLPATKDAAPPQLASQAPVLFELPAATDLPGIVGEMLRLGNDRQSFRWLSDENHNRRVLLRVIGPPYYTLLRALDHLGTGDGPPVRAYLEAAPRVWVQIGYTHPAATGIKPADGQVLLLRAPRDWEYVADAPFQDVYDILQFKLPTSPTDWTPAESTDKLDVKLKLVPGNAADSPELWVLKGDAIRQLDEFVRDSDERLTNRLKFAVADAPGGGQVVVLRVSPSKLPPPALQFAAAVGFKPYFKLPNLFLPVGTRLHPQLRRDAVRTLLADDTDLVVWLYPGADGTFTPETLSENAFRPLEDWVEYVIETAHAPLKEWIDASRFRFEAFVCADGQSPKPKPPSDKPDAKGKGTRDDGPLTAGRGGRKRPAVDGETALFVPPTVVVKTAETVNEAKIRLAALEADFLAVDGPLDDPERVALWPSLAEANAAAKYHDAAAVCWANAAWASDDPAVFAGWAASDAPAKLTADEFDRRLNQPDPTRGDARQMVAATLGVVTRPPAPSWFAPRLPALRRYFEANEAKLPVRSVWLLATHLEKGAGADVLGLARVRDRLLNRLLDGGLNAELDIPFFLRTAGLNDSERVRMVRDKLPDLHKAARAWVVKPPSAAAAMVKSTAPTLPYIDLLFAFALAKLGESVAARTTTEDARRQLGDGKPTPDQATTRALLFRAYQYRVEQALANKPHAGPLPPELAAEIDEFQKQNPLGANAAGAQQNLGHYPIARLREQSKVLEPQEKLDPYNEWMKHGDDLKKRLAELQKIKDPAELAKAIRDLYRTGGGAGKSVAESRFLVLHEGMPHAARVSEEFTVELLNLVPETMAGAGTGIPELGKKQGQLLERSLFLAAHFDRRDLLQQLVDQFIGLLQSKSDEDRYDVVNFVAGQCLRSLRKLGLQDEIDKLLKRLVSSVLGGQTVAQFRVKYASQPAHWGKALQSLLHIAGGWLSFGLTADALPILDEARNELLGGGAAKLSAPEFTKLTTAYISAVGHGPVETGLPRLAELLTGLDPNRVTNTFTTAPFYSRLHLNVVEEMVLAVASDEFALGAAGRRWLDDDEYLVRKRIHADMRKQLSAGGL